MSCLTCLKKVLHLGKQRRWRSLSERSCVSRFMNYPYFFVNINNLTRDLSTLYTLPHLLSGHRLWYNVTSSDGHGLD